MREWQSVLKGHSRVPRSVRAGEQGKFPCVLCSRKACLADVQLGRHFRQLPQPSEGTRGHLDFASASFRVRLEVRIVSGSTGNVFTPVMTTDTHF